MKSEKFRIRLKDYYTIRRIFPSKRNETVAEYFGRLTIWLETYVIQMKGGTK